MYRLYADNRFISEFNNIEKAIDKAKRTPYNNRVEIIDTETNQIKWQRTKEEKNG